MDFQTIFQEWLASLIEFLPKLISGIFIFIATLFLSSIIAKAVRNLFKKKFDNVEILHLIYLLVKWAVLITGTIIALDQVEFNVTGFIAGLGVAGFTIGFALQDIAKNFISGLLILARQPFNLGEQVKVADYMGRVREITVRDTVIETLDGELVIIPNQKVFENPIINYTDVQFRRRTVMIGLGYEEDAEQASEIFLETIKSVPGVAVDPAPSIKAQELGDSALMLEAFFWVDQKENNLLDVHSEVVKAIKLASETNKINLPYPVQTLLMKNIDE